MSKALYIVFIFFLISCAMFFSAVENYNKMSNDQIQSDPIDTDHLVFYNGCDSDYDIESITFKDNIMSERKQNKLQNGLTQDELKRLHDNNPVKYIGNGSDLKYSESNNGLYNIGYFLGMNATYSDYIVIHSKLYNRTEYKALSQEQRAFARGYVQGYQAVQQNQRSEPIYVDFSYDVKTDMLHCNLDGDEKQRQKARIAIYTGATETNELVQHDKIFDYLYTNYNCTNLTDTTLPETLNKEDFDALIVSTIQENNTTSEYIYDYTRSRGAYSISKTGVGHIWFGGCWYQTRTCNL